jgi:hypothetical protein
VLYFQLTLRLVKSGGGCCARGLGSLQAIAHVTQVFLQTLLVPLVHADRLVSVEDDLLHFSDAGPPLLLLSAALAFCFPQILLQTGKLASPRCLSPASLESRLQIGHHLLELVALRSCLIDARLSTEVVVGVAHRAQPPLEALDLLPVICASLTFVALVLCEFVKCRDAKLRSARRQQVARGRPRETSARAAGGRTCRRTGVVRTGIILVGSEEPAHRLLVHGGGSSEHPFGSLRRSLKEPAGRVALSRGGRPHEAGALL